MGLKHVLALALVLSVLSMSLSQAEDQPPSGPPDMLALYLTRIDAQSMRLVFPAQQKTYTLCLTPQTVFCKNGRRAKSWEYLKEHIDKDKPVLTVKTDPAQKVALVVWNTGPSVVSQGTSLVTNATRLDFPAACVKP